MLWPSTHFVAYPSCSLDLLIAIQVFPFAEGLSAFGAKSQAVSEEGTRVEDSSSRGKAGRPRIPDTISNSCEGAQ